MSGLLFAFGDEGFGGAAVVFAVVGDDDGEMFSSSAGVTTVIPVPREAPTSHLYFRAPRIRSCSSVTGLPATQLSGNRSTQSRCKRRCTHLSRQVCPKPFRVSPRFSMSPSSPHSNFPQSSSTAVVFDRPVNQRHPLAVARVSRRGCAVERRVVKQSFGV